MQNTRREEDAIILFELVQGQLWVYATVGIGAGHATDTGIDKMSVYRLRSLLCGVPIAGPP